MIGAASLPTVLTRNCLKRWHSGQPNGAPSSRALTGILDHPDPLEVVIVRALHAHAGSFLELQVVDDLLCDLFARGDHGNPRRVWRDDLGADAAGALLERHEFRRRKKCFARREPYRRHFRQMIGSRLEPSFENAGWRENVDRAVLARQ